jgi:hypothetical protein
MGEFGLGVEFVFRYVYEYLDAVWLLIRIQMWPNYQDTLTLIRVISD